MLVAVAVNVTDVPAHTGPVNVEPRLTAGVRFGFTVIVMEFEEAVFTDRQDPPVIVIAHVITSPFTSVEDV